MNSLQKALAGGALVLATLTGGAVGAAVVGTAGAQTTDNSTSSSTTPAPPQGAPDGQPNGQLPPRGQHDPSQAGHMANGITEELLTGDTADQVSAAAQSAVPDGTIQRVETDAEGATYEAHVVKSDGTEVTVKVNADFSVASVENGHA